MEQYIRFSQTEQANADVIPPNKTKSAFAFVASARERTIRNKAVKRLKEDQTNHQAESSKRVKALKATAEANARIAVTMDCKAQCEILQAQAQIFIQLGGNKEAKNIANLLKELGSAHQNAMKDFDDSNKQATLDQPVSAMTPPQATKKRI